MWQTLVDIIPAKKQFSHADPIFSIGSCFADEMGHRLAREYFDVVINPFGVLYNPVSIANIFKLLSDQKKWDTKEIFFHENKWRHFDFHSRLSQPEKPDFIESTNNVIKMSGEFLERSSLIIITLGTAFVWEKLDGEIVGNCHKIPSDQFSRRLLSTTEITDALTIMQSSIQSVNPNCHVILTVSPVRHLRDGLVDNNWSKSRLIDGCRTFSQDSTQIDYFPSYEITMDELRDYRFYKRDKVHLSEEAVDYIYSRFFHAYFGHVPKELIRLINRLNKLKDHHITIDQDAASDHLANKTKDLIQEIKSKFNIDLEF